MSLKNLTIKKEYRSLLDKMSKEFYTPLLSEAVLYKRAVGYFSSSVLVEISDGLNGLINNGGTIQLVASPNITDEDLTAIRNGYDRKTIIFNRTREALELPKNAYEEERLNYLANLIAEGYLDIKIAVIDSNSQFGIYHEKVGIIEDIEGNKVAFSGSMNETATALAFNYETIDVFCSWTDDAERVNGKENAFSAIWNDCEPGIKTYEFSELSDEIIRKYRKETINCEKYVFKADSDQHNYSSLKKFFDIPDDVELYDYQKDAIATWIENGCCGVFDMATGSGKTYTALGALSKLSELLSERLAVVIVAPYQHLVEQWTEDIEKFNVKPIVAYSSSGQNWRKLFSHAVNAYNIGVKNSFCIITTNASFALDDFQKIIRGFKKDYCIVIDEAHNFGAKKLKTLLPLKAKYRLALSATIERYQDEEGTASLRNYFGKTCITFSLKDAIDKGFLTSYYYYPVLVHLSDDEFDRYVDLTKQIIRLGGMNTEDEEKKKKVELLLIKRARIIAGCKEKVDKLIEVIKPFKDENYMLIYCGATRYDRSELSDDDQIRQIEEVNKRLYNDLGIKVRKFTSLESKEERKEIKEMFQTGTELQAITAIKCLDEGVNIPAIKKAFILASSTNPKEYIQRRGRVLRRAAGKEYAEIYDFITLPRRLEELKYCSTEETAYDLSLINKEFQRLEDFAATARNPHSIDTIKYSILDAYHMDKVLGGQIDE